MSMYKKCIVITSIFEPTDAVMAFSKLPEYRLLVVGDKKTPGDWYCNNVDYISVAEQNKMDSKLAKAIPFNHYCRKMLGYLAAIRAGADCIVDTDDDNIPKLNWAFPSFDATYDTVSENQVFVNIYQLYTQQKIWPRGLPLNRINTQFKLEKKLERKTCRVGVWQGLADEDPDVDAIYRLTIDTPCYFNDRDPVVLGRGTICPFNTQNTMIRKELFAFAYALS